MSLRNIKIGVEDVKFSLTLLNLDELKSLKKDGGSGRSSNGGRGIL